MSEFRIAVVIACTMDGGKPAHRSLTITFGDEDDAAKIARNLAVEMIEQVKQSIFDASGVHPE